MSVHVILRLSNLGLQHTFLLCAGGEVGTALFVYLGSTLDQNLPGSNKKTKKTAAFLGELQPIISTKIAIIATSVGDTQHLI